jgi:hypothetical protein
MVDGKSTVTKQCASIAGKFEGHADVLKQCTWHHPMQQIQGHITCPWKPSLGNYLLHITPVAARATINKQQSNNTPTLLTILMAIAMRRYNTACIG